MDQLNILVIATHPEILPVIVRLINTNPEWRAIGSLSAEEALELFNDQRFDMVLLGGGLNETTEKQISIAFTALNPGIRIVKHYGGGSGLLKAEIQGAIDANQSIN